MRIAMWSGPRNLSTATMYAFANRADFAAVDEPFYAAYLARTGLAHPMREEVLAAQSQDYGQVIAELMGPLPDGAPHVYHKHMTQHMLPDVPLDWLEGVVNVFLIRHPARVEASFRAKYEDPTLDDLGFQRQAEIFDHLCGLGQKPVVVDSADIRDNPEAMLRKLCDAINLPFDPAMLKWQAGGHDADGVWAAHWYGAVHQSTGFAGPEGPLPEAGPLTSAALPYYQRLADVKLT